MSHLFFLHITLINHNDVLLPEIVNCKNLSYDGWPSKKGHPSRNLSPPNILLGEAKTIITSHESTHDTVKGFNTKQSSFGRNSPQLFLAFLSHSPYIQHPEERGKGIDLSIMSRSNKAYVSLNESLRIFMWSTIKASFALAIPNKPGKASLP